MVCQFPLYQDEDKLFVSSFGIELEGMNAKWGPGRRGIGIIHYVLSGEGFFNGHPVCEGHGFYIPPNSLCEYGPSAENPWTYFWIDCSADLATQYVQNTVQPDENGIFAYHFKGKLQNIINSIFSFQRPITSVEALKYAFSVLSLHTPSAEEPKAQHYVRQAKRYIESAINRKLTVCDVADAISIHDRYLYTLFVTYEHMPPKEYILKCKLETAKDLLENTQMSVCEVAAAVGFTDLYSFSRLFKGKIGMSPTQYRKSLF